MIVWSSGSKERCEANCSNFSNLLQTVKRLSEFQNIFLAQIIVFFKTFGLFNENLTIYGSIKRSGFHVQLMDNQVIIRGNMHQHSNWSYMSSWWKCFRIMNILFLWIALCNVTRFRNLVWIWVLFNSVDLTTTNNFSIRTQR